MANFTAIAGVSSTLRTLLRDRMEDTVDITIAPPDVIVTGSTGRRLNLYLYQITENPFLKNQEIPGQGHPANFGHPPLSLDLSYLMTAFGATETNPDADLQAQQMLGDGMRVLHDFSVVTDSLHMGDNPASPLILDPSLVSEFERIKITLQPATLDEFSKIWTALPVAKFRRSVAYQVSVIQIVSQLSRKPALPVRERRVYAFPLQSPFISDVRRDPPFDGLAPAVAEVGDPVLVLGRNLNGAGVSVHLSETIIPIPAPQQGRIAFTIPASATAGTHTVRVVRDLLLAVQTGQPPVAHRGFESNVAAMVVIPQITLASPASAGPGDIVTITVAPPVLARQAKTLILGDVEVPAEPVAPGSPPSSTVDFRLPSGTAAIPPGSPLMRIRIDGAESRLSLNAVTQVYDTPTYTVTP
jgi:hypothetical protein